VLEESAGVDHDSGEDSGEVLRISGFCSTTIHALGSGCSELQLLRAETAHELSVGIEGEHAPNPGMDDEVIA